MKIDLKLIIISALSILTLLFVYLWWTGGNDFLEKQNKKLNTEIKKIQEQRDSLLTERKILESQYKAIQERIKDKENFINSLNLTIEQYRINLKNTQDDLDRERKKLAEIDKEIEKLKKAPFERVGEQLFNSLKNKLK